MSSALKAPCPDASVLADGQDHQRRPHVDQLDPHDRFLHRARRHGETGVLGETGEELHAPLEHLFEVDDRVGEVPDDEPALRLPQASARGQGIHEVTISGIGRDAGADPVPRDGEDGGAQLARHDVVAEHHEADHGQHAANGPPPATME